MKGDLVNIESPYAGDIPRNVRYAKACMMDSLQRGEFPLASHLLYTHEGLLNDLVPEQRELGLTAGFRWADKADLDAVYTDLGISKGMQMGIDRARAMGQRVEERSLPGWMKKQGLDLNPDDRRILLARFQSMLSDISLSASEEGGMDAALADDLIGQIRQIALSTGIEERELREKDA